MWGSRKCTFCPSTYWTTCHGSLDQNLATYCCPYMESCTYWCRIILINEANKRIEVMAVKWLINQFFFFLQKVAERYNCQQCLWLYGPDHTITEVGAMNIFILLDKGNGAKELVTPPLEGGIILPGITRFNFDSFLFYLKLVWSIPESLVVSKKVIFSLFVYVLCSVRVLFFQEVRSLETKTVPTSTPVLT